MYFDSIKTAEIIYEADEVKTVIMYTKFLREGKNHL